MKKGIIYFFLNSFLILPSIAQQNFIPGEIVTKGGAIIQGMIDYRDWSRNPTEIRFTIGNNPDYIIYDPTKIQSFSTRYGKYVSRKVTIDTTPLNASIGTEVKPSSKEGIVFLKVLAEGQLTLLQYKSQRENYYVEENGIVTELISHEYVMLRQNRAILVDQNKTKFLTQLKQFNTNCEGISTDGVEYKESDLIWFINSCNNPGDVISKNQISTISIDEDKRKTFILPYLAISRGTVLYNVPIDNDRDIGVDKASTDSYTAGVKFIFVLPRNLGQRALTLAVDYSDFTVEDRPFTNDYSTRNLRFGYLIQKKRQYISPEMEVGFFIASRVTKPDRGDKNYDVLLGVNVSGGVSIGILSLGAKLDFTNIRINSQQQSNVSVYLGIKL